MIDVYTDEEDNSEACDDVLMLRYGIDVRDKKQQQEIEQELKGKICSNCGVSNVAHAQTCIVCQRSLDPVAFGVSIERPEINQKEFEETKKRLAKIEAESEIIRENMRSVLVGMMGPEKKVTILTYNEETDGLEGLIRLGEKLRKDREEREKKHEQWHKEQDEKAKRGEKTEVGRIFL